MHLNLHPYIYIYKKHLPGKLKECPLKIQWLVGSNVFPSKIFPFLRWQFVSFWGVYLPGRPLKGIVSPWKCWWSFTPGPTNKQGPVFFGCGSFTQTIVKLGISMVFFVDLSHEKSPRILSIESWLVDRDSYNMAHDNNPYISLSRPGPWKKKFERLIFPTRYSSSQKV